MERKNAWNAYDEAALEKVEKAAQGYKKFIDQGKTERECAYQAIETAKAAGYTSLEEAIVQGKAVKPGDKLYQVQMGKAVMLFHVGKQPIERGMNIVGAHIDSPRIDVKQNPFYEDNDIAYADTHYYGGIKKYQWVARALALHGVVAKKDGTLVNVVIGEDDGDPVVGISDLLIHLSQEQMVKKASEVIGGEDLDIMLAGRPLQGADKEPVKAMLLSILKEKYGLEEEDMLSAEIEAVPAGKSRDYGLDRSMILGYGHDDRVCAYAEIEAMLQLPAVPEYTCCCLLADKEEIGSVGATGMQAKYFENAVAELLALTTGKESNLALRRALANSRMLSCDVSAGFDPLFASAFEKKNAAFLGRGVCYNKFTGSRGKSGSNDANAEFLGRLRKVMDDHDIAWQTAELGRVDLGGGGTIAYICALYGMEVIDSGVPVLSMHAPQEIINKADLYEAIRAYTVFMTDMGPRA
ncbi:MAG: aminopeptidase [Clostridia bacterium]|nr:aminopeptidase [Clostridia bacterium]